VTGPAVIRLFKLFDHQGIELINIKEVLVLLSNYADFTREDKMRYAFTLYDTDDSKDLSRVYQLMPSHVPFIA
jgi:Ca2+-binding EF-hand superfamily protein